MRKIKVKTIYRHFKGGLYFVEDVAINSETEVIYAVYRALTKKQIKSMMMTA